MGLSTDTKPTDGVFAGSTFFETDTKRLSVFDGSIWTDKASSELTLTEALLTNILEALDTQILLLESINESLAPPV